MRKTLRQLENTVSGILRGGRAYLPCLRLARLWIIGPN